MRESDLYQPVKDYLEAQGYEVKAEIGACDVMARRGEEPPLVVELKTSFSLALVLQAVARQAVIEHVYLGVAVPPKRGWGARYKEILRLCRRLGLGLLAIRPDGVVEAHLDPGPYQPRRNTRAAGRLLREFERRVGDPNNGGTTGVKRVTAYRQDALRCAVYLQEHGSTKGSEIAKATDVERATRLMRDDHYGWFERVEKGVYALTPAGVTGLETFADALAMLAPSDESGDG
ncbi:MAG: DUF2161 domain-containing phosphodiesterase [Pseudomonadota bacterium]